MSGFGFYHLYEKEKHISSFLNVEKKRQIVILMFFSVFFYNFVEDQPIKSLTESQGSFALENRYFH